MPTGTLSKVYIMSCVASKWHPSKSGQKYDVKRAYMKVVISMCHVLHMPPWYAGLAMILVVGPTLVVFFHFFSWWLLFHFCPIMEVYSEIIGCFSLDHTMLWKRSYSCAMHMWLYELQRPISRWAKFSRMRLQGNTVLGCSSILYAADQN